MARISEFSTVIDEEVLSFIAARFIKKYPLENGAFLFGEHWPSRFNIPYITRASIPSNAEHTKEAWSFDHAEVLRQTRLAAADGRMLLGWAHSHPWKNPILGINMQTITDARLQKEYRFTVSYIIGIWEYGWWCNAWREGFAAPLDVLVKTQKGKLETLKQWYYHNYAKKPWYITKNTQQK